MKTEKITQEDIEFTKKIFGTEPYKVISHPISEETMAKELSSDRMNKYNELFRNMIKIDDWGEEGERHPGYENMNGGHADWQKRIIEERQNEFKKNREQLELEDGIRRRYLETEDCFFA